MNYALAAVACVTFIFGVLRFVLPVEGKIDQKDIFKDLAHLWVGGLFGAAIATGDLWLWSMSVGLTGLEVVAFVVRRES